MTGKLHKSEDGWVIIYQKNKDTTINYPLYPDDVNWIKYLYENLDENKEVDFQLTKKYLSNETIVYAKIIKKKNKYNLNPNDWILIKHETIQELISDAKTKDVDTEILEAIFEWIKKNNTLNK